MEISAKQAKRFSNNALFFFRIITYLRNENKFFDSLIKCKTIFTITIVLPSIFLGQCLPQPDF